VTEVPFLDLRAINMELEGELGEAAARVVQSGWFILGREVAAFEEAYARSCGSRHCVGVANGLDAIVLALRALDVGPGCEVIVPSNTYIATWLAVSHVGATPIPVEPCLSTYNLDPAKIEDAITERTRVIIPVHLYGQPADLDPILDIARRRGLGVIEDGAQAHGARYKGERLGKHGDAVTWSFYPGKNLGALGDGGAVTTDDPTIADRIAVTRNYGSKKKYYNDVIGYNSRLDEMQAAFLQIKLQRLDAGNSRRRDIANTYTSALQGCGLVLPEVPEWADPVWHLYVVRHRGRDELAARLKALGVNTMIHYPVPPHLQPAYAALGKPQGSFPISEKIHDEVLSLPIGPTMTDGEVERVIEAVRRCA